MTSLILALVAALAGPFAPAAQHTAGEVRTTVLDVEGWRLETSRDAFLDRSTCRLRRGPMTLDRGVMMFQFPHATDTAEAQFKIDDGPAQRAGAVAVEVAGQGVALNGENLRYPPQGRVAIPVRLLRAAHGVAIRPNMGRRQSRFDLTGLSAALAASQRQGCPLPPDTAATS